MQTLLLSIKIEHMYVCKVGMHTLHKDVKQVHYLNRNMCMCVYAHRCMFSYAS